MARVYKRDKLGRFASGGGTGSGAAKRLHGGVTYRGSNGKPVRSLSRESFDAPGPPKSGLAKAPSKGPHAYGADMAKYRTAAAARNLRSDAIKSHNKAIAGRGDRAFPGRVYNDGKKATREGMADKVTVTRSGNKARQVTRGEALGFKSEAGTMKATKPKKALPNATYATTTGFSSGGSTTTRRSVSNRRDGLGNNAKQVRKNNTRNRKEASTAIETSATSINKRLQKPRTTGESSFGLKPRQINNGVRKVENLSAHAKASKPARAKQALAQIGPEARKGYMRAAAGDKKKPAVTSRSLSKTPVSATRKPKKPAQPRSAPKMLGIPSPRQPSYRSEHANDLSAKVWRDMQAKKSGRKPKFGSY